MNSPIKDYIYQKITRFDKILILGFGKEGNSTYKILRELFPHKMLVIADAQEQVASTFRQSYNDEYISFIVGNSYLSQIQDFDLIFKSPRVSLKDCQNLTHLTPRLTSQTHIFLEIFREKTIGITGTKGKSTTASLIFTILKQYFSDVLLVGNIGIPVFDALDQITEHTLFIYELSSHQLEYVTISPKYSILLNIFQEHLDFYDSYTHYINAKLNILRFQKSDDILIYNGDDTLITTKMHELSCRQVLVEYSQNNKMAMMHYGGVIHDDTFSYQIYHEAAAVELPSMNLKGKHNLQNIMAAFLLSKIFAIPNHIILERASSFKGLPHRMEYFGQFKGIDFYDDSIATIPEATVAALQALQNIDTLIVGGVNRGISYQHLIDFLSTGLVKNLILIDDVGKLIYEQLKACPALSNILYVNNYIDVVKAAYNYTAQGHACLLSPASSSYNMFRNFEERGYTFQHLVRQLSTS